MAPYLKTLVDSVQYFVRNFEHQRARAVCYWAHCGRGAQRYAVLKEAIEVLGEDVTDEERDWYEEMKAAKQKGFSDQHEVGCRRPPLSTRALRAFPTRTARVWGRGCGEFWRHIFKKRL